MNKTIDLPLSLLQSASRGAQTPGTWLFNTLRTAQASGDVCYLLDEQRRFIYCNPAWDRFAEANGAPQLTGGSVLGTDVFAVIPGVLSDVYARAFKNVGATGRVWSKLSQCSSSEAFRRFRMRIHPVSRLGWFLVSHALVVERPHRNAADRRTRRTSAAASSRCVRTADRSGVRRRPSDGISSPPIFGSRGRTP
jgi:hypothetical protein